MFLLVSVRHVGADPDEHQHGLSIQISINLGKTFLRISRIRNIILTWILTRVFAYLPPFISQILDFIYWTILILIYFEWRDIENQQLNVCVLQLNVCVHLHHRRIKFVYFVRTLSLAMILGDFVLVDEKCVGNCWGFSLSDLKYPLGVLPSDRLLRAML